MKNGQILYNGSQLHQNSSHANIPSFYFISQTEVQTPPANISFDGVLIQQIWSEFNITGQHLSLKVRDLRPIVRSQKPVWYLELLVWRFWAFRGEAASFKSLESEQKPLIPRLHLTEAASLVITHCFWRHFLPSWKETSSFFPKLFVPLLFLLYSAMEKLFHRVSTSRLYPRKWFILLDSHTFRVNSGEIQGSIFS